MLELIDRTEQRRRAARHIPWSSTHATQSSVDSRATAKTYGELARQKSTCDRVAGRVRRPTWRLPAMAFHVIEGEKRLKLGDLLAASALRRMPGLTEGDLHASVQACAPPRSSSSPAASAGHKIPQSSNHGRGAAKQNILLAAHAWLSRSVKTALGLRHEVKKCWPG